MIFLNGQIELPSEFDQLFSNVTTSDVTPAALSRYIQQALEHQARLSILSRLTVGFQRPGDPSVKPDDFDGSIASSLVALSSSRVVMVNQKGGHRVKQRRETTQHHRKIEMQRVVRHNVDHWCFLKKQHTQHAHTQERLYHVCVRNRLCHFSGFTEHH